MQSSLSEGTNRSYTLTAALLVYGNEIATLHRPVLVDGRLTLGEGSPLTEEALRDLVRTVQPNPSLEIFPESLLYRDAATTVWFTRTTTRRMWFNKLPALNGQVFHQPPCVWAVRSDRLFVRAFSGGTRPTLNTSLLVAPYWNVDGHGLVCTGSMTRPPTTTTDTLGAWIDGFFNSTFTHANAGFRWKKGITFEDVWKLAQDKRFLTHWLAPASQTLHCWLQDIMR
jgi:PRTRC genetic system protein B